MTPTEGPRVMSVGEGGKRSTRVNSAYENHIRLPLQSAATNGSTFAQSDGGRLALKRTRSRFADEEQASTDDDGEKTIVSFSQGDPGDPYNWPTVYLYSLHADCI